MQESATIWSSEFVVDYLFSNIDTVFHLIDNNRLIDLDHLSVTIVTKNTPMVKQLLEKDAVRETYLERINCRCNTPLFTAISQNDTALVQTLLDFGADPTPVGGICPWPIFFHIAI